MSQFTESRALFQLSGGRELLNAQKTEELLQEWIGTNPTSIKLSNKSFDLEASNKIADFFSGISSNIEIADISDIIAGRPEEEALKVLKCISNSLQRFTLTEVNLSDNAMGAKGVDACQSILKGKGIQKLYVCNDGLSAEAATLLADILLENEGSYSSPLTLFHFYNNMGGNGAGIAVGRIITASQQLTDLKFSATRCGNEGCLAIANSLGTISQLTKVDLSDNTFGVKACAELARSLTKHAYLEQLNLRDDGFDADGVEEMLTILDGVVFPHLTFLDLSGNDLNEEVMEHLADWLIKATPNLQTLLLDDNEIGSDGAILLTKAIPNLKHLKHLSICTAEITGKGGLLLAKSVIKLPEFLKLDLNGNAFAERAVEEITNLLLNNSKILGDLEDNDEDGEDDISEVNDDSEDEDEPEEQEEANDDVENELSAALQSAKI